MKGQKTEKTAVIIIGGSLVGLSAAMFLAGQKVPFILIEKHAGSSKHPRAIGFPERTMELYRAYGIEDQIPQISDDFDLRRATVKSLDGKWISESTWTPKDKRKGNTGKVQYSPCAGAAIPQDKLEPILRKRARELGADLRSGTELYHFEQNEKEVIAYVKDRSSGHEYTIKGQYIIAADGNKSPIREALNIGRSGIGKLQVLRSVLFKSPLGKYLKSGISQFEIEQTGLKAFLTTYGDNRWVLMFKDDIDRNENELLRDIQKAIGRNDLPVEIITTGRWELSALIADKFKKGRVFLAGDSAHTLPPTRGGFGANTGIHDANNLAWKLKAVLSGDSAPELLDTYQDERQPVAWVRYEQMFARPDYARYISEEELEDVKIYSDVSMELGQIYRSKGIVGKSRELPDAMQPNEWKGKPGIRAPHIWVTKDGQEVSTLDLFQKGWVILTANKQWKSAAEHIAVKVKLDTYLMGDDFATDDPQEFKTLYGIDENGAVLVRPDGFIAWKTEKLTNNLDTTLADVVERASFSK